MARSGARAAAMQLIYERLMGGSGQDTLGVLIDFTPEEEDSRYINTVVEGVAEHVNELDALIASYSPSREIDRIARVDLCILRVALYEMRYCADTPESVAINEAVELAKRFSEPASARFINGVLGAISRSEQPAQENGAENG
ncbi:MAG: transcription antitermination factor NusB [Clostridia bacterium]|nr:transcription antitermination factor NusB [Clostridia bacterium]MBR6299993.1 transcription antitermination factor NusB [Clostridia bacterium]